MRCRGKILEKALLPLAAAVEQVKQFCPVVGRGVSARPFRCLASCSDEELDSADAQTMMMAQIPDGPDVGATSDGCVNKIVISGVVSDVTTGFHQATEVLQFVLDQEYVVRSPLRDGTRSVSWAQGLAGKEVVVTGRLRLDPYVTAATRKNVVFRVPCVWIYPDVLESSVHVLMQS